MPTTTRTTVHFRVTVIVQKNENCCHERWMWRIFQMVEKETEKKAKTMSVYINIYVSQISWLRS